MQTETETETYDPICQAAFQKVITNAEFVQDFMMWGSPMKQVWMMEAICKYAEHCIKNKKAMLEAMQGGFVSGQAWIAAAEEWQKAWNANYR